VSAFHEIADVNAMVGDPAGDRCANLRPFQIEFDIPQSCLGPKLLRLGRAEIRIAMLGLAL
jgi:hypothetical protein